MRKRIAQLLFATATVCAVVAGLVVPADAAPLVSVDYAGASCIMAISNDAAAFDSGFSLNSTRIGLRCNFSGADSARAGTTYDGDGNMSTFNSLATGSIVQFYGNSIANGRACTAASVVIRNHTTNPSTHADHFADATFQCSSISGGSLFGSGSISKTNFSFFVNGGTPYGGLFPGQIRAVSGGTTANPTTATVLWANFNTSYPAFWWVADPEPVPDSFFCAARLTMSSNAATPWAVPVAGPSAVVGATDIVTFDIVPSGSRTDSIQIEWWPGGPWTSMLDAGWIPATPLLRSKTIPNEPGLAPGLNSTKKFTLGTRRIRCLDMTTQQYTYALLGDSFAGAGTTQQGRPCELLKMYWPTNQRWFSGVSATFAYDYAGVVAGAYVGDSAIHIDAATRDPEDPPVPMSSGSLTWTTVQSTINLGAHGSFPVTAAFDAGNDQFILRCVDRDGIYFSAALLPRDGSSIDTGQDEQENCLKDVGLGLAPSSWIPGLFRMGSCIVKVWTIPSAGFIQGLAAERPSGWLSTPLTQFTRSIDSIVTLVTVSDAQVSAGNCGFAFDLSAALNSHGVPGASTGTLEGSSLSANVCGTSQERTLVTISRYLSLAAVAWTLLLYVRHTLDARS